MRALISMSGIIGKSQDEVLKVLNSYFNNEGKELKETALNIEVYKLFLLNENKNNCVILYPEDFLSYKEVALYLEETFNIPIFNFHIYDLDLWVYEMYYEGKIIDKFNPLPKYIEEIQENEVNLYKGNPEVVCKYLNNVKIDDIIEYYKPWTDNLIQSKKKAYTSDEFSYGVNWQCVDFMKKLNLNYPIIDEEETIGRAFKLI